jgi:cell wall-associated NlpC family hydrolase
MISVPRLVKEARSWVGVRFLHQGRSRYGVDCLGFIASVLNDLGSSVLLDHLPADYGRDPQSLLLQGLEGLCRQIPLQPGALIAIQFPLTPFPSHAAIYTGESIVHSLQSNGKVIETSYGAPWTFHTRSIWALPLVVYQ